MSIMNKHVFFKDSNSEGRSDSRSADKTASVWFVRLILSVLFLSFFHSFVAFHFILLRFVSLHFHCNFTSV